MKLVKVEVIPKNGIYHVHVTFDDAVKAVPVPENPNRIVGLDLGTNNFAAVTNNFGEPPVLIGGGAVKATNQWFNKEKARAASILAAGHNLLANHSFY